MLMGRVKKLGANIDMNTIIPPSFFNCGPEELGKFFTGESDERPAEKVTNVGILVAGENFGCGSVRYYTPNFIKASGVGCIIAESFTDTFLSIAMNNDMPAVECQKAVWDAENGDMISVDLEGEKVYNITKGAEYRARVVKQQELTDTYPISC